MDLEGEWNPPETWPDESPPLPGWKQTDEGGWEPPAAADGSLREGTDAELAAATPPPETKAEPARPRVSLTYADHSAGPITPAFVYAGPTVGSAIRAAIVAAVIAAMIATGLIVLISLL